MDPTTPPPPACAHKLTIAPTFYQTKKTQRNWCHICCCCICCLIFLIIIIGIICGLFFAWFQPKIPIFHFSRLELDPFNINVTLDGNALLDSNVIVIRVEAKNPNSKLEIYYGDTQVILYLNEEIPLGSATFPSFVQPANNVTLLKFTLDLDDKVIDSTLGLKNDDDFEVNAAVKTKVGIGVGKVMIGMLPVNVNCTGITLKRIEDDNVSPNCSFNTLRWITID